jgi:uncharacterized protein YjiS (DUF1127 family)
MSVIQTTEPLGSSDAASHSIIANLLKAMRQAGQTVSAILMQAMIESRVRRAARELARLDDRMLQDIGLTRTEIDSAVRHGRHRGLTPIRTALGLNDQAR